MTHQDFNGLLKKDISQDDFVDVNYVYTFHPAISETEGKKQIAQIYKIGGMQLIRDMMPAAQEAADLEEEKHKAEQNLQAVQDRLRELKSRYKGVGLHGDFGK